MADSSQAREVVLEVGKDLGTQTVVTQVQSGTVEKQVFDGCEFSSDCYQEVLNSNGNLLQNWNEWHRMSCSDMNQYGNSPGVYPINSQNNAAYSSTDINYIFDEAYDNELGEANIIVFSLYTLYGNNPEFNGITWSANVGGVTAVDNLRAHSRDNTEQGRMLYLIPRYNAGTTVRLSFEILEGQGGRLIVRGSGDRSIGAYLAEQGLPISPEVMNDSAFWGEFDYYISPYVHGGNWKYDSQGNVKYSDAYQTIHCSYVKSSNGADVFASMVQETNTFGLRSSDPLFNCFETDTEGFRLEIIVEDIDNCIIEVLTQPEYPDPISSFAFEYQGVAMSGSDYVWSKIQTNGTYTVCVPYYYNTVTKEEQENQYMAGSPGGYSTSQLVQTGGGGQVSGQAGLKTFYDYQYRFLRITKIDESLPAEVKINRFFVKNSGYNFKTVEVPVYTERETKVPAYTYYPLDIYDRDKVPLSLNFNSGDLRDPSKRSAGYSKTFELPASNRNQKALNVMTADGSNRNIADISWKKARISSNGIVVFRGYARIEQSSTGRGGKYSCHILQDPTYWPEMIGESKLCDLNFPEHEKSYTTVTESWTKGVDEIPYVYPAINYGKWNKDTGNAGENHTVADFHPALYVRAIVDKIFNEMETPYTIVSKFFDTSVFKKLIIPYTSNSTYTVADQENLLGEDSGYSSTAARASNDGNFPDIPAAGITDGVVRKFRPVLPCVSGCEHYEPGSYSSIQNGYTVPFTGRYNIQYSAQVKIRHGGFLGGGQNDTWWAAWVTVNGQVVGPEEWNTPSPNGGAYMFTEPVGPGPQGTNVVNATSASWRRDGSNYNTNNINCFIDLQQGDKVQITMYGKAVVNAHRSHCDIRSQSFGCWPVADQAYVPPGPVDISQSLSCGVKQIDFLKGITEMFNLYWTSDNEKREIYVEPYDDFYGSGKIVDWSQKIDRKNWTDKFLIDELAKNVICQYKVDTADDLVKIIDFNAEKPLWSITMTSEELYRKKESTIGTTIFSPTYRILDKATGQGDLTFPDSGQAPIMPCMWSGSPMDDGWINNTSRPTNSTGFNIRILNWGGLSNQTGPWTLIDDNGNPQVQTNYPYAYTYNMHQPSSGSLENNLAWHTIGDSLQNVVYLPQVHRGLFDRYYGRWYEKISGGAALRTCFINLSHLDISQFDFRDVIKLKLDGGVATYWTVNKIIDYKPGKAELTKVELVEWKYGFTYSGGKITKFDRGRTNYGSLDTGGRPGPTGGINTPDGGRVHIDGDGKYLMPTVGGEDAKSTMIKVKNNLTLRNMIPEPVMKNHHTNFTQQAIEFNQYNGITNAPATPNALHENSIDKNSIAFGHGLQAAPNQTVLGSFNKVNGNDTFQVGGGYKRDYNGGYERLNAISVSKDGYVSVYGGEVVADFSTKDVTITGDIYCRDDRGNIRKLYLKERIDNR